MPLFLSTLAILVIALGVVYSFLKKKALLEIEQQVEKIDKWIDEILPELEDEKEYHCFSQSSNVEITALIIQFRVFRFSISSYPLGYRNSSLWTLYKMSQRIAKEWNKLARQLNFRKWQRKLGET